MNKWRKTTSKFHDSLSQLIRHYSGETLRTSQIKRIIEDATSIKPLIFENIATNNLHSIFKFYFS